MCLFELTRRSHGSLLCLLTLSKALNVRSEFLAPYSNTLWLLEESKMPGEKAVCVLLPNGSDVKGTIHFEEVREFLNVAENLQVW